MPKLSAVQGLPSWLGRRACSRERADLERSALVVAPHQDDETLGCGGTVIRKRDLGADVSILFMTDGSASHAHLMPARQLADLRQREALNAATTLGCQEDDVQFLGFPDGHLSEHTSAAVDAVESILRRTHAEEVYVPYRNDGPSDHEATYRIVLAALARVNVKTDVFEYPIWYWHHWPWIGLSLAPNRKTIKALGQSAVGGFGMSGVRRFRSSVFVGDVLETKRRALECHESQMSSCSDEGTWLTLHSVAEGDFLECFFQPFEVFAHSQFSPA